MFVGHFAIDLGAKHWAPTTSIGTLMFAALLADLWAFVFVAVGIEHISIRPGITRVNALDLYDFAWSYSLVMDVMWAALLAAAYFLTRRYGRGAWVVFPSALSHWVLYWASHTRHLAGHLVLWIFIVVFTALWLLSFNGAPPPSIHVLVTVDLILFPIVLGWAYWIDRLRQPNETSARV